MNTNKIREALERVPRTGDNNVDFWIGEALAELYKAPKVLTDDMVSTVANLEKSLYLRENGSEKEADIWARGVMSGMIQARDNGYLAPAAEMTDERPWMNEWQRNMCKKSKTSLINIIEEERDENDRLRNSSPAVGLTVDEAMECVRKWIGLPFMTEDLHTRLTAKLNSKNNVH